MKILKVTGLILLFVLLAGLGGGLYINYALPNTGAADTLQIAYTPERLERGRYLANHVAACMDCHSSRDWELYSGPMKNGTLGTGGELFDEKMGFPGKIYASNLTPHALSNWTDGELFKAITTGESKDGRALFPVMAYERFGKMDKNDLYSIIAYIRSIKPIKHNIPVTTLNFPVNLINKTLPKKANPQTLPKQSDTVKYGGYLANAAGCVDCHSQTEKGKVIPGSEYGGGMEFKFPDGTLRSPNITMHKTNGLGNRSRAVFVQQFKRFADPMYQAQKTGMSHYNTPMPWTMYAEMETKDLEAIYAYLKSLPQNSNKVIRHSPN